MDDGRINRQINRRMDDEWVDGQMDQLMDDG